MMSDATQKLKKQVFATNNPSRAQIVRYFKAIMSDAKKLPVSRRDDLAYEILRPYLQLDNPPEDDPALYFDIVSQIGGSLDTLTEDAIKMGSPEDQDKDRKRKDALWLQLIQQIESLH